MMDNEELIEIIAQHLGITENPLCECCDYRGDINEMRCIDGYYYCENCCLYCEDCEAWVASWGYDDVAIVHTSEGEKAVCRLCFEHGCYGCCNECFTYFAEDELIFVEDKGIFICEECNKYDGEMAEYDLCLDCAYDY